MGDLKVTIEHGHDPGPRFIGWMLAAGITILAINAQAAVLVVSAAVATALMWLAIVASVCMALWTAVAVYTRIRDRPVYEAIQRDTESNLSAYRRQLGSGTPPQTRPLQVESTRVPDSNTDIGTRKSES